MPGIQSELGSDATHARLPNYIHALLIDWQKSARTLDSCATNNWQAMAVGSMGMLHHHITRILSVFVQSM